MKKYWFMKKALAVLIMLSMALRWDSVETYALTTEDTAVSETAETVSADNEETGVEAGENSGEDEDKTVMEELSGAPESDNEDKTDAEETEAEETEAEETEAEETGEGSVENGTAADMTVANETSTAIDEAVPEDVADENTEETMREAGEPTAAAEHSDGESTDDITAAGEGEEREILEDSENTVLQMAVDGILVALSFEKGVFPEGVTLDVQPLDAESEDQLEVAGKVVEAFNRDAGEGENYAAVNTSVFDIHVLSEDGEELQPDTEAGKAFVTFCGIERPADPDGAAVSDDALHLFHMSDVLDQEAEELEKVEADESSLLSGALLSAEGAVIDDVSRSLSETVTVTAEAEHFSLYVLSWRVGNMNHNASACLYDGNTCRISSMMAEGDMLDIHGYDTDLSDRITGAQVVTGSDVISLNTSGSPSNWTITGKKAGNAAFDVSYNTVNGGRTTSWVIRIRVDVRYFAEGTENGSCGVNVTWSITGSTLAISGSGEMYDYTSVTNSYSPSIAPWAAYAKKIATVTVGEGVTKVGTYAFCDFEKLTSLSLPSTLEMIGNSSFRNCKSLQTLALPESLEKVGNEAFCGCNELSSFTIPASVTSVGLRAFYKDRAASDQTKNVITNTSSVLLRGLHEYNQNYSSCPTGKTESEYVLNDSAAPSMISLEITGVTDRNAEYKIIARDNLDAGIDIIGFVTTESTVTDPKRVAENGVYLTDLGAWNDNVNVTEISGGYRYAMEKSLELFEYEGTETQLDPDKTYYIYVIAEDMNGNRSSIMKRAFTTTEETACITPYVSLESGTYVGPQTVTITARTAGSTLYYEYNKETHVYSEPFTLSPAAQVINLYVWAEKAGLENSTLDLYTYTILDGGAMSGNCGASGADLSWQLLNEGPDSTSSDDFTLVISGSGPMQDYSDASGAPWYRWRNSIHHILIKNGATSVGNYAFRGLDRVSGELVLPDSVKRVGDYSFSMDSISRLILGKNLQNIGTGAFRGMSTAGGFEIPASVMSIGNEAFYIIHRYDGAGIQNITNYSGVELVAGNHYNENYQSVEPVDSSSRVRNFVKRMYSICMGREPDDEGLSYWTELLLTGKRTGVQFAWDFVLSKEFTKKNYCNKHFIEQIYPALMGRTPDAGGFNYWVGRLDNGMKREELLNSFTSSTEYKNLCASAGFEVGTAQKVPQYGVQPYGPCTVCGEKSSIVRFVERMYTECLKREAETDGLNYWSRELCNHTKTGKTLLDNFFLSKEIQNKNLTNQEYVKRIYKAMLNRNPDSGGLAYWVGEMDKGRPATVIIASFVDSNEFKQICDDYGIQRR